MVHYGFWMILGAISGYFRVEKKYYQMYQRLWNESVAEALKEREESTVELLRKFEVFMKRHGYEKKILASQGRLFFALAKG